MQFLDDDAQPPSSFNRVRRSDRSLDELIGLARGMMMDGRLDKPEFTGLVDWLYANREVCDYFPGSILAARVERIMRDGKIEPDELEELGDVLRELTGESGSIMAGASGATTLPLCDPPPQVEFEGMLYCFTGKFVFGPRRVCEDTVVRLGGQCASGVSRKVDYVVIGTVGSRDWIHSSFGRKIERAAEIRDREGYPLAIISEDHWAARVP